MVNSSAGCSPKAARTVGTAGDTGHARELEPVSMSRLWPGPRQGRTELHPWWGPQGSPPGDWVPDTHPTEGTPRAQRLDTGTPLPTGSRARTQASCLLGVQRPPTPGT